MASHALGPLPLSDPDRALTWLTAFAALARSKGWLDDDKAKFYGITDNFLACCGLDALATLQRIVLPQSLSSMPFADIQTAIQAYVQPKKKLVIAERSSFNAMRQAPEESVVDFVARLRHGARYCDFEKLKVVTDPCEELIRVALVSGLHDGAQRHKVLERLQTHDLSVEDICDFLRHHEQIAKFANTEAPAPLLDAAVHHSDSTCRYCGTVHPPRRCPAFGRTCKKCSKKNHFANVCRSAGHSRNIHGTFEPEAGSGTSASDTAVSHAQDSAAVNHLLDSLETIELDAHKIQMQRDSGACASILSTRIWTQIGKPALQRSHTSYEAYDDHIMHSIGKFTTAISVNNRFYPITFTVIESNKPYGLLGRDFLREEKSITAVLSASQSDHPQFLSPIKGVSATMELVEGAENKFCRARPVPIALENAVGEELDRLERMGVITPITSGGVDNASPVVWVRKDDGSYRMCADFKVHVNSKIKSDAYPIPKIETIFSKLKNANKFAKLDLTSAYWQIELDEKAKKLSVINTSKGLYQLNRLQMGMKNASAIFQRVMEQILTDLKGVIVYQDDILVFAENDLSLRKRLSAVKSRLQEKNVTISEKKSTEFSDEVSFLGFKVSARGIAPDDRLV